MTALLSAQNLSFTYANAKQALKDISFNIEPGCFCALLGPNGAGKSTFFAIASALNRPTHGNLFIHGYDIAQTPRAALALMGFVFQQTTLDLDLSILQNLRYFASLHGIGNKLGEQRIQEELERLDLYHRRHEKVRQLNGGHRRRAEIARALLHHPALLLLDEASVGLDIATRRALVDHVHQLCQERGTSVLWATHLIDEVRENDQTIILHNGQIVGQGTAHELAAPTLEQTFNDLTQRGQTCLT
ncbi:ATP-binding cassette domain-containing protein [Terasakiella sp.]|uniref:ATP-binding cassette domain-containing protein n=1 Tax=Terasakiella sp. TaxID=2034861 RepID=UPI003AA7D1CB